MGFLVSDYDILTCAHVIEAALGTDWQDGSGEVQVCFPFSGAKEGKYLCLRGHVDRKRWYPRGAPKPGKPADIAVIVLQAPAPTSIKPGKLLDGYVKPDVTVKIFGFPAAQSEQGHIVSHPTGLYIEGKILGDLPSDRAHFQGTWETGTTVQPGFSGASVYDPLRDRIVGMVVRADCNTNTKNAEVICAPSLQSALKVPAPVSNIAPAVVENKQDARRQKTHVGKQRARPKPGTKYRGDFVITVVREGSSNARKQLGVDLTITALKRHGFRGVARIKEVERLFDRGRSRRVFGTLFASRNGKRYVFEVVTRKKLQTDLKLNPRYILVRSENAHEIDGTPCKIEKHYRREPRWIAVRFDLVEESYCIYTGGMQDLHKLGIPMREADFARYECLALDRTLRGIRVAGG